MSFRREEIKLSIFSGNKIIYMENLTESTYIKPGICNDQKFKPSVSKRERSTESKQ